MRKLIKKILNESSELEWIKDVKTNQDIAQEIADESEIKKDDFNLNGTPIIPSRLYTPFTPFSSLHLSLSSYTSSSSSFHLFTEYCKEQYGLSKGDIDDVWERYKDIIKDEVNNI